MTVVSTMKLSTAAIPHGAVYDTTHATGVQASTGGAVSYDVVIPEIVSSLEWVSVFI